MSEQRDQLPWLLTLSLPEQVEAGSNGDEDLKSSQLGKGDTTANSVEALPETTLGLALSGGGIRSASFSLGVLQSLSRSGWLPWVDYLSTVSGGGYTGGFLGRFFDLCHKNGGIMGAVPDRSPGAAQRRVAEELNDSRSQTITWLRRHSNYLAPTGTGDSLLNLAAFWRNFLSLHSVLAFLFLAIFGLIGVVGYSDIFQSLSALVGDPISALTPVSRHLPGEWSTTWVTTTELLLWLAVVPLMIAYWIVSQDELDRFVWPVVSIAALLSIALLVLLKNALSLTILLATVAWALEAVSAIHRKEGHGNQQSPFRLALARNHLTYRLAMWVTLTIAIAALAIIDGLGQFMAREFLEDGLQLTRFITWFGALGAYLIALAPALRLIAQLLANRESDQSASRMASVAKIPFLPELTILALGAFVPLVVISFVTHLAFGVGYSWFQGAMFTGLAVAITLLLGTRRCLSFVNRSGPLTIYTARLARAFLGAVNPARYRHVEGSNVTHVIRGDDLPFDLYKPHEAGGPLHIINCSVNETFDVASQRGQRDRKAENLAVGPAGISIAQKWHAIWTEGSETPSTVTALNNGDGPHPLLDKDGGATTVERLNLRQWMGISGAALSPGMGRGTGPARSLLFTLANLRLGYWWDSNLQTFDRKHILVDTSVFQLVKERMSRWLQAQSLLLAELRGRFGGPWQRYWYLSDGGNFEMTGVYELLRRRVPFIIACDAGRDEKHLGADLARLTRIARIDLGANFESIDELLPNNENWTNALQELGVPLEVAEHLGTLNDLLPAVPGTVASKHATLFRVTFDNHLDQAIDEAWHGRQSCWLLYLKATCTGDESADLLHYRATHPDFPDESTSDQFFDEPQWESYRKLGTHIGRRVFTPAQ